MTSLSPHSVGWLVVANQPIYHRLVAGQIYEIEAVASPSPPHYHYKLKGEEPLISHSDLTPLQGLDPVFSMRPNRIEPGEPVCVTNEVKGIEVGLHRVISLHWDIDNNSGVWLRVSDGVIRWTDVIPLNPSDDEGKIGLQYLINAYRQTEQLMRHYPLDINVTALRHNIRGAIQELASS